MKRAFSKMLLVVLATVAATAATVLVVGGAAAFVVWGDLTPYGWLAVRALAGTVGLVVFSIGILYVRGRLGE